MYSINSTLYTYTDILQYVQHYFYAIHVYSLTYFNMYSINSTLYTYTVCHIAVCTASLHNTRISYWGQYNIWDCFSDLTMLVSLGCDVRYLFATCEVFTAVLNISFFCDVSQLDSSENTNPYISFPQFFRKIYEPLSSCRHQKGDIKRVQYWGSKILEWPVNLTFIRSILLGACVVTTHFCTNGKTRNAYALRTKFRRLGFEYPCFIYRGFS
jgi:hypothetical protein